MLDLKPELHDFGKIISHDIDDFPKTNQEKIVWHGPNSFANVDWNALGRAAPTNPSWLGAVHHHDAQYASLTDSPAPDEFKADIVLLMIADNLAATSSRAVGEDEKNALRLGDKELHYVVQTLWNPPQNHDPADWTPIKTKQDALELIELIRRDDAEQFRARYQTFLPNIPEEKNPPAVVTSLETHMRLVNKYYAVLKRHVHIVYEGTTPRALEYNGVRVTNRAAAKSQWTFELVKGKLSFPQMPARVRDLHVFAVMEKHTRALLESKFSDYILFHTTDTLYLFLPQDGSVNLQEIFQNYLDDGFYVELEQIALPLNELTLTPKGEKGRALRQLNKLKPILASLETQRTDAEKNRSRAQKELDRLYKLSGDERKRWGYKIPQLERDVGESSRQCQDALGAIESAKNSIEYWEGKTSSKTEDRIQESSLYAEPIAAGVTLETDVICELCQVRPATRAWTTRDGLLRENLCDVCYTIREQGSTQGTLADWEERAPNTQVAWVKLALDYDWAQLHIETLFEQFADELCKRHNLSQVAIEDAKASLRSVALVADFTRAYLAFTERFHARLRTNDMDIFEWTRAAHEFCIVRLNRASDAAHILNAYRTALQECFPRALEESPVRLSISISTIKHPFFDHWRFCQKHDAVMNIQMVGRGELHLDIAQYDLLATLPVWKNEVSTFLHRVATIEQKTHSRILPQLELMQDEHKLPDEIAAALRTGKLDWREVLNFYKLVKR